MVGDDPAVAHGEHPVGKRGDIRLMRDDNDRDALLAIECNERLHDLMRGAGIEVASRFVCQQQTRRVDQCPGDGDALLLSTGELSRRVAFALGQTEQCQSLPRPRNTRPGTDGTLCRIEQWQSDILDRTGAGQQIETLKHEAEAFTANAGQLRLGQPGHVDTLEEILSAAGSIEAAQNRHQSRFAGSGRAHDGNELAGLDRDTYAVECADVHVAGAVCPRDILDPDDRLRHHCPAWLDPRCGQSGPR